MTVIVLKEPSLVLETDLEKENISCRYTYTHTYTYLSNHLTIQSVTRCVITTSGQMPSMRPAKVQ